MKRQTLKNNLMRKTIPLLAIFAATTISAQKNSGLKMFNSLYLNAYVGVDKFPEGTIVPPTTITWEFNALQDGKKINGLAVEWGITGFYNNQTMTIPVVGPNYTVTNKESNITTTAIGGVVGLNYYLDDLIGKNLGSDKLNLSVGIGMNSTFLMTKSDIQGAESSSTSATSFYGNAKAKYFFTNKLGILGVFTFAKGGTGIGAGLSYKFAQ